jgi:hypothetical protein
MLSNESREALLRFVESAIKKKEPTKEAKFDEKDDEEINAAVVEAFKSGVFTGLEEKSSMHVVKSIVRYLGGEDKIANERKSWRSAVESLLVPIEDYTKLSEMPKPSKRKKPPALDEPQKTTAKKLRENGPKEEKGVKEKAKEENVTKEKTEAKKESAVPSTSTDIPPTNSAPVPSTSTDVPAPVPSTSAKPAPVPPTKSTAVPPTPAVVPDLTSLPFSFMTSQVPENVLNAPETPENVTNATPENVPNESNLRRAIIAMCKQNK